MLEELLSEKIILVIASFVAFYAILRLILWYFDHGVVGNIKRVYRPVIQENSDGEIRVSFGKTNHDENIMNTINQNQQKTKEANKSRGQDEDYVERLNDDDVFDDKDLEGSRVIGVKAEIKGKWTKKVFDRFMNDIESKNLDLENSKGIFTAKEKTKQGVVSGVNNSRGGGAGIG